MPIIKHRLIDTQDVPQALDAAMSGIAALRAEFTDERTDIGNHGGDQEYLNIVREAAALTRDLMHDLLAAASNRIGKPQRTYDVVAVKELEGVDLDIVQELEEMLITRVGLSDSYPPSNTDHLINRNGSVQ